MKQFQSLTDLFPPFNLIFPIITNCTFTVVVQFLCIYRGTIKYGYTFSKRPIWVCYKSTVFVSCYCCLYRVRTFWVWFWCISIAIFTVKKSSNSQDICVITFTQASLRICSYFQGISCLPTQSVDVDETQTKL